MDRTCDRPGDVVALDERNGKGVSYGTEETIRPRPMLRESGGRVSCVEARSSAWAKQFWHCGVWQPNQCSTHIEAAFTVQILRRPRTRAAANVGFLADWALIEFSATRYIGSSVTSTTTRHANSKYWVDLEDFSFNRHLHPGGHSNQTRRTNQAGRNDSLGEQGEGRRPASDVFLSNPFKPSAKRPDSNKFIYFVGVPDGFELVLPQ